MAPRPTLPRQRPRYTRILDVAAGFARKGLESVVLSAVAAKADVPLGTLYWYFSSATQLVLAPYRKQLTEPDAAPPATKSPGRTATPPAGNAGGDVPANALVGVVMEIFHMRLMQAAVEQCLNSSVYSKDSDTTRLIRGDRHRYRKGRYGRERRRRHYPGSAADRHWTGPIRPMPAVVTLRSRGRPQKACFLLTCTRRSA